MLNVECLCGCHPNGKNGVDDQLNGQMTMIDQSPKMIRFLNTLHFALRAHLASSCDICSVAQRKRVGLITQRS